VPLYLYDCEECGEKFELLRGMSAMDDAAACPRCASLHTSRKFGNVVAYVSGGPKGERRVVAGSSGCGSCGSAGSSACASCSCH